jgi:1-acyl-sn-glycerol-3-phosphate acyltransferase
MANIPGLDVERDAKLYNFAYRVIENYLTKCIHVTHEGTENLRGLENRPFIVLPFHHTNYLDVPLEAHFIKKNLGRPAYFVMGVTSVKPQFRKLMQRLGGIPILRAKDKINLKQGTNLSKEDRLKILDVYKLTMPALLERGEIIMVHPEAGIQNIGPKVGKGFRNGVFEGLIKSQEAYGPPLKFVPLILNNKLGWCALGGKYTLTAGKPFEASTAEEIRGNLEAYLKPQEAGYMKPQEVTV